MKKILVATLSSVILGTTLVSCGDEKVNTSIEQQVNVQTSEIVEDIKNEIKDNIRATALVEDDEIYERYYINSADVLDITIENGMINTGLEIIAVAKVQDGKIDNVKEAMEKIIEDKRASAFYPGEEEAVENTKIVTKDNYIALFVLPDEENVGVMDKAIKAFEDSIK